MKRIHLRSASSLVIIGAGMFAACTAEAPEDEDVQTSAGALAKAAFTTFVDADECLHGSGNGINCNHYASKQGVYMNGGPVGNVLPDGEYYFVVLEPGAQNGGYLDGANGNLSDPPTGDSVGARTFTMEGGNLVYGGAHDQSGATPNGKNAIQLYPFDDTSNNGGVYILAICKTNPRSPRDCKYDMFKVTEPICGDGEVHGDEECEWDEDCDAGYTCEACECVRGPYCGDGCIDEGEECEANTDCDAGYSCQACECVRDPYCGDGMVDAGEECDDGNQIDTDACTNECTCATCGDGIVWSGQEECDDGNSVDDDACSNSCEAQCVPLIEVQSCDPWAEYDGCPTGYVCDPSVCECVCEVRSVATD